MSSILEALYEGDICPAERFQIDTEEYHRRKEENMRAYDSFFQTLEPDQRNAFDDLLNRQFQSNPVEYAAVFAEGFRMGARMMLEIWDTKSF